RLRQRRADDGRLPAVLVPAVLAAREVGQQRAGEQHWCKRGREPVPVHAAMVCRRCAVVTAQGLPLASGATAAIASAAPGAPLQCPYRRARTDGSSMHSALATTATLV